MTFDGYDHLRDDADEALARETTEPIGRRPRLSEPHGHLSDLLPTGRPTTTHERRFGIPPMLPGARWDSAMRHSDARRGYTATIGVR